MISRSKCRPLNRSVLPFTAVLWMALHCAGCSIEQFTCRHCRNVSVPIMIHCIGSISGRPICVFWRSRKSKRCLTFHCRKFSQLLPADYCQREGVFDVQRIRTEFVWKWPIRFSDKVLRLKAPTVDNIHYCQLGKMAVVTRHARFTEIKVTDKAPILADEKTELFLA